MHTFSIGRRDIDNDIWLYLIVILDREVGLYLTFICATVYRVRQKPGRFPRIFICPRCAWLEVSSPVPGLWLVQPDHVTWILASDWVSWVPGATGRGNTLYNYSLRNMRRTLVMRRDRNAVHCTLGAQDDILYVASLQFSGHSKINGLS